MRNWDRPGWHRADARPHSGTSVYLAIALDTRRTLDGILRAASCDGGLAFQRTQVPLRLLAGDQQTLASRADAKRVAARLVHFNAVEIDFSGVQDIGHAFADELFRVFQRQHPQLRMTPVAMAPQVSAMLESVGA